MLLGKLAEGNSSSRVCGFVVVAWDEKKKFSSFTNKKHLQFN